MVATELGKVIHEFVIQFRDEELVAMVCKMDCGRDGFIDVEEFVKLNKLGF